METLQASLFALQDVDLAIDDLREKMLQSRQQLDNFKANTKRRQDEIKIVDDRLKSRQVEAKRVEGLIESCSQKKKQIEQKIQRVSSPRELEALQHEIENLIKQVGEHEEKLLLVYDEVETLQKDSATRATDLKNRSDELPKREARHVETLKTLEAQIAEQSEERTVLTGDLDRTVLGRYEGARKKHGGKVLFAIEENSCGGCGMPQIGFEWGRLRQNPGIAYECSECGRVLVYTGEAAG